MYKIMDAAFPPVSPPDMIDGVMGYIGGRAEHVWTLSEWLPYQHMRQFPVWVADLAGDAALPSVQGAAAAEAARSLGWAPWMEGNGERVIVFDMETSTDRAFYAQLATPVLIMGFVPVAYGSMSTVLDLAASDVLAALWDVIPVIPAGQTLHGLQYEADVPVNPGSAADRTTVDYSTVDAWFFNRGGTGPRKAAG